jgi:hydroxypyruvate isomerase
VTGTDPDRDVDDQLSALADNLAAVSGLAEREGLTLMIEAVAEQWVAGLLLQRVDQAASVVRSVNSSSVGMLFDVAHVGMAGDDIWEALDRYWDLIGAVQVADLPGRIDLGAGDIDWPRLVRFLVARDYRGLVEIEHDPIEVGAIGEERLVERLRAIGRAVDAAA